MKTLKITLTMLIVALSTIAFGQKTIKVGHINSNELLTSMPEKDSVQKEIETFANQLRERLDAMRKEYETKVAEFQGQQDVMAPVIKESKIAEITELEKRIVAFQQTAETNLQKKEAELLQPIIDKAKTAIEEVAKENNYTYVLDSSGGMVLYSIDSDDILSLVKKKLNIQL